jgi:hypothetical protein
VKAVFVSKDPKPFNTICYHFTPLTFDIRLVTDPCLLVESVKREAYDLIIVNTLDFPRHWKPIIKLVREYYTKEQTVFILLVSGQGPFFGSKRISEYKSDRQTGNNAP